MAYHGRRNSTQPTPRGIMGFPETIALPAHWLKKLSVNLLHKFGRGKPGDENDSRWRSEWFSGCPQ